MSLETEDEALIVRYLLNELPAAERRRLEERYFGDDGLYESVCAIEEQLIRDYLRGELPGEQSSRFEAWYLESPQLARKVESTRLLIQAVASPQPAAVPAARSIREKLHAVFERRAGFVALFAAGLATAALLFAIWLGLDNRRVRSALERSEAGRLSLASRAGELSAQGTPRVPQAAALAFVLSPGVTRGDNGATRRLIIPATGVDRVRLNLRFTPFGEYAAYRTTLLSAGGAELARWDIPGKDISGSNGMIGIEISAASLPGGDYVIVVKGLLAAGRYDDLESYAFHVVRAL